MTYLSTGTEAGLTTVTVSFPYGLWMIQAFSTSLSALRPRVIEPLDCVTVTSLGLPVAPAAVTRMIPTRGEAVRLAEKAAVIVPAFVPLVPDGIVSQSPPATTAAVQPIVPPPELETAKVVVPARNGTSRLSGVTDRAGLVLMVKPTARVVVPLPLVVLVKVTVSLYVPSERAFAQLLIDTVTVVEAPAAKVAGGG